jgi:carboxypeptidase T
MKHTLAILVLAGLMATAHADSEADRFSLIRIVIQDESALRSIYETGIDHEGTAGEPGGPMEFVAGPYELRQLDARGISYEIVVDDLAGYYAARLTPGRVDALGFGYGSMGGYYTFAEVVTQLDSMRMQYPGLITSTQLIGTSVEGRAIWAVKISDNPYLDEPDEPEVLYTALHHAREPQGMMATLYYMWWLLENHGVDPEATYLVNSRQMWFIPVVNPDGYVHNQTTNPNGGGMWRKNRRNNGGSFGVDLNRNYGPFYMWNAANGGSSTSPSSETYRGIEPFSEPETQTIDNFLRGRNIKAAYNYHTYSNLLIYPWGYLSRESPDTVLYRDWTHACIAHNSYTSGTDLQTVGYSTRGNSDDYMYGDTTKPRTYAMTPEVGTPTDGFWPATSRIFPLAIENLHPNKLLAYFAGHYPVLRRAAFGNTHGDEFLRRGEPFTLTATVRNLGASTGSSITVNVTTNSPHVQINNPVVSIASLAPQTSLDVLFEGAITPDAVTGVAFKMFLEITDPQGFLRRDTINCFLGVPSVVFADSAQATSNWSTGSGWGLTSNAHTPPYAFTDSPSGTYPANANNSLTLLNNISLVGYNHAELRYWAKWAIEPTFDFGFVEVSTNNGSSWSALRSPHMHQGSGRSTPQQTNVWGYEGYSPGSDWVEERLDLSPFAGTSIRLRFRLASNASRNRDGLYVDDIRVYGYTVAADTGFIVQPSQLAFSGLAGSVFNDAVRLYNNTQDSIAITLKDSVIASTTSAQAQRYPAGSDFQKKLERLKRAVGRSTISPPQLDNLATVETPDVYATIITDARGELPLGGADVYRVDHQVRTVPFIGTFHDFRVVMAVLPDTNIAGFISIDTDQRFGTGAFPTPYGIGPTSRDIGSEREVFFDASGIIVDSLLGIGRIPAGVVLSTVTDTIVGIPFLLSITRDSVLTITTSGLGLGIQEAWLGDTDRNMNVGVTVSRFLGGNPLPDYAPEIGHGTAGTERGVSWMYFEPTALSLAPGDSAIIPVTVLAARPTGTYNARLLIQPSSRPRFEMPFQLNVTGIPAPVVVLGTTQISDTLQVDSTATHEVTLSNTGNAPLFWGIADTLGTSWMTATPQLGTTPAGGSSLIGVTLNATGLAPGATYTSHLLVLSNDPQAGSILLPVALRVEQTTSITADPGVIPEAYALYQNYPNPFNPATTIRFDLPEEQAVQLTVFNLLGQEVARLAEGRYAAGVHSVKADFHALPSGVYMYRLRAGAFVDVKKLLVVK